MGNVSKKPCNHIRPEFQSRETRFKTSSRPYPTTPTLLYTCHLYGSKPYMAGVLASLFATSNALLTPEYHCNCNRGGRYATCALPPLIPYCSQPASPEETLSRGDQLSYAGLDSHSLALCSDVRRFLRSIQIFLLIYIFPAQTSPKSLSHQKRHPEE